MKPVPLKVKTIQEQLMQIEVKPIESMADYHFQNAGVNLRSITLNLFLKRVAASEYKNWKSSRVFQNG